MNKPITDFLTNEYLQFAIYQSFRSIASYVDGMKPSSRKIIHTVRKLNLNQPMKVARLSSKVAEETEWLHGEGSLEGVIVGLAQDFTGSNNVNLLKPEGSFGSRFIPQAAASRYIFTRKADILGSIFSDLDESILIGQEFEGTKIEPRFFVPSIPLILVNGSEGIGNGYAQNILPRNIKNIVKYIGLKLNGSEAPEDLLRPFYKGFKGIIEQGDGPSSWVFKGLIERVHTTKIRVTEIPIGHSLATYRKILDELEDARVIKGYEDLSENDSFLFELNVTREFTSQTDEQILSKLKLIKRDTENYTCIDENNKIRVFKSAQEIIDAFIEIRKEFYIKRKQAILEDLNDQEIILKNKMRFIELIIDDKLKVFRRPLAEIEKDMDEFRFFKLNDSYRYLTSMHVSSFTKDDLDVLQKKITQVEASKKKTEDQTEKSLWLEDLRGF